jgi:hypothetical protein
MSAELQEMIHFHLTGKRAAGAAARGEGVYPAPLAPYRELAALRYDFPVVLLNSPDSQAAIDTLTGIVNRLLREIAPEGNPGLLLRQHVLRLEARMRALAAERHDSSLAQLWKDAEKSLLGECDEQERESLGNSIATARFGLRAEGQVVDCEERLPTRLLEHAWSKAEARRATEAVDKIQRLIVRLRNMLKVDDLKNGGSRTPQKLKSKLGKSYRDAFDFELMAEVLEGSTPHNRLPAARRNRIRSALGVLESQRFFDVTGAGGELRKDDHYLFLYDSLSAALKAYNERLPAMAEVVKALEIAELECDNAFREDRHGSYFERFGPQALAADDMELFPTYLVSVHESECNTRDTARLMEIVSGELPMKVLVHVSNPLGEPSPLDGHLHSGSYVQQLVQTFIAGSTFVLQAAASNLYRQHDPIRRGFDFAGPAIFSVFVPFNDTTATLPGYLVAAAGMESRVFPTFSYDPNAGPGLAQRFDITGNPDVESDWPVRSLVFEDEDLQAVSQDYCFTLADFAVIDPLFADHFAEAPRSSWSESMLPVAEYLELEAGKTLDRVPYVAVVDGDNRLRRFVVDDHLIRIARRCRERWHALQELGSVHNSYAQAQLRKDQELLAQHAAAPAAAPATQEVPLPDAREAAAEAEPAAKPTPVAEDTAASEEPWIETPRCTTCDECTKRNDRMFAYDDNKQAYIKDPDAGTYRDLVDAAEMCQVAIIHPGKPRNPDEPGLAELVERAAPFNEGLSTQ